MRKRAVAIVTGFTVLAFLAVPAFAGHTVHFAGSGDANSKVQFDITVTGHKDKPEQIDDIFAKNVKIVCPGDTGRTDLDFFPLEPIDVEGIKTGHLAEFDGRYKDNFRILRFRGELSLKRRDDGFVIKRAEGDFRVQQGEGGVNHQHCDTGKVEWKADDS